MKWQPGVTVEAIDADLRQPVGFLAVHRPEDAFDLPRAIRDRDPGDETDAESPGLLPATVDDRADDYGSASRVSLASPSHGVMLLSPYDAVMARLSGPWGRAEGAVRGALPR